MKVEAFFKTKDVRLFHGDVIEIINQLPDRFVDLIFADPPYKLSNDGFTCHSGKQVSVNKGDWDKSMGFKHDYDFHHQWLKACRRILKPEATIWVSGTYHSIYQCGYAIQALGYRILNDITWFKPNASPNLSHRFFTASHETLIWARKEKKSKHKFDYEGMKDGEWKEDFLKKPKEQMRSVWAIDTPKPEEKKFGKHPTQKPEALLERIVLASSREGDIILDPFCGSATTGVVALRYRRKFMGIDLEQDYLAKLAIPRIKDVLALKVVMKEVH
jgi:site-specific DNA-methyltransferase (adenine-specific)